MEFDDKEFTEHMYDFTKSEFDKMILGSVVPNGMTFEDYITHFMYGLIKTYEDEED